MAERRRYQNWVFILWRNREKFQSRLSKIDVHDHVNGIKENDVENIWSRKFAKGFDRYVVVRNRLDFWLNSYYFRENSSEMG